MTEVNIQLRAKGSIPNPIFSPGNMPVAKMTDVTILEAETNSGKTGVAICLELPDGKKIMTKTTARIIDGIAGAVRGACLMWGDHDNWKDHIQQLREMAIGFQKWMNDESKTKTAVGGENLFNEYFQTEFMNK